MAKPKKRRLKEGPHNAVERHFLNMCHLFPCGPKLRKIAFGVNVRTRVEPALWAVTDAIYRDVESASEEDGL